jgi:hypothetical protein
MARTLPHLLHNLYYMSLRDNLCIDRKYYRLTAAAVAVWNRSSEQVGIFLTMISSFDLTCCATIVSVMQRGRRMDLDQQDFGYNSSF